MDIMVAKPNEQAWDGMGQQGINFVASIYDLSIHMRPLIYIKSSKSSFILFSLFFGKRKVTIFKESPINSFKSFVGLLSLHHAVINGLPPK